jgi:glycosyltransferase involved in cell wall biosynthesis
LKVALVHDWLTGMRGGEKCLEVLCELYPEADLFTLLHNKGSVSATIERREIHTSFVQHLPLAEAMYRNYLPLFPKAIERFDFTPYDLIISTSHCVAKGAIPREGALHICYCHTPMRYVWEMYEEYFGKGQAGFPTRMLMSIVAPSLRRWDVRTSNRVHYFIANSENVRRRIQRHYHRDAEVIYPPVDASQFQLQTHDDGYFLIVSAFAPYKRIDIAIEAFNELGERLVIVGDGPEGKALKNLAKSNIEFAGWASEKTLAGYYQRCTALIFPGEEDFGIVPVEAMAAGKPVIAYGRGGALETVMEKGSNPTGIFFYEQSSQSLLNAINKFRTSSFNPSAIRNHALQFDRSVYKAKMKSFIEQKVAEFFR